MILIAALMPAATAPAHRPSLSLVPAPADLRPAREAAPWGYDLVILRFVKTAISLPDETFERVQRAAARLGVSRSEFFARAAERWLDALDDDTTTDAINRAIDGLDDDAAFVSAAAAAVSADPRSA